MADRPDFSDLLVPKAEAINELKSLINKLDSISEGDRRSLESWYDEAVQTIEGCFTSDSVSIYFEGSSGFDFAYNMYDPREFLGANTKRTKGILRKIIDEMGGKSTPPAQTSHSGVASRKIFIVHGHDGGARDAVARTVSELGLDPIILHEQPNQGATIIEKFVRHSHAGFAIILLTPDDKGRAKGEEKLSKRARQNVILEMGYFIGKLGRERVMVLLKGDIEMPSDIIGVAYEPLDDGGAWRFKLGKELQAAGYDVDLNKL